MKKWLTVQDVQAITGRSQPWVTTRMSALFRQNPDLVKRVDHPKGKGYRWYVSRKGLKLFGSKLFTTSKLKRDTTRVLVDNLFKEWKEMKADIEILKNNSDAFVDRTDAIRKALILHIGEHEKGFFTKLFHRRARKN